MEQAQQYVGIDLHRRRNVIVRRTEAGETLDTVRIDNDATALAEKVTKAGPHLSRRRIAPGSDDHTNPRSRG